MKNLFTVSLILFFFQMSFSQTPFITTWKTDNPGSSNNTSVTIFTEGSGYDYDVDWDNDGNYDDLGVSGNITHDFGAAGTYTIRITGDFPRIHFGPGGDRAKILSVDQWGDIVCSSMYNAFQSCTNLNILATDTPDLSGLTNVSYMFSFNTSLNANLNNWDLSNVTRMEYMFYQATSFNGEISNWNVSNVTDMRFLFTGATAFNGDLSNWDVGEAKYMSSMFHGATSFNADISNWDVSNVELMLSMFLGATSFDQDLSGWDVSSVTNFNTMFYNTDSFNCNLGNWNITSASDMYRMLSDSGLSIENYDKTLIGWNAQGFVNKNLDAAFGKKYCLGKAARDNLVNNLGWYIWGDAHSCPVSEEQTDNCYTIPLIDISSINGNNNSELYIADNSGSLVGTINANGNDLGPTSFTLFVSSNNRNTNGTSYMNRDVQISPTFQPSSDVTVKLFYTASEWAALQLEDPTINLLSDLEFVKTNSSCNGVLTGNAQNISQNASGTIGPNGNIFLSGAFSSFSNIHVKGILSPLPVQLLDFDVRNVGEQVELKWKTNSEYANSGFEIEHRTDDQNWKAIGFVKGNFSSNWEQAYDFVDLNPLDGNNYYRLKQLDENGQYFYSVVRSVAIESKFDCKYLIYPNPSFQNFNLRYTNSTLEEAVIKVFNNAGQVILQQELQSNEGLINDSFSIDVPGVYLVEIRNGHFAEIQKLIIK